MMDRESFRVRLVFIMTERGFTLEDTARRCRCAIPTVQSWLVGESAPHAVGRQSVLDALRKL